MRMQLAGLGETYTTQDTFGPTYTITPDLAPQNGQNALIPCLPRGSYGPLQTGQEWCDPSCVPFDFVGPLQAGQSYCLGTGPESVDNNPSPSPSPMSSVSSTTWLALGGVLLGLMLISGGRGRR